MNARTGMLRWAVLPALVAAALALVGVFALDQTALAQEGDDRQAPTPEPDGLFYDVKGEPPPSIGVDSLASRLVGIDYEQLAQVTAPPISPKDSATETSPTPQTLVLNLFDDVVFTGMVEHIEPTSSGHALWGSLDGVELGTMTLVVNGSVVVGTVRTPVAVYTIRTVSDGTYVIRQIDESSLPPLGEPLGGPLSAPEVRSQADDVPLDDGSEIDVMVVYTPLAKRKEGGRAAIEALIDLFVAETNQAYANSRVTHRIRLVLREEVDYTESGNSLIDLDRLKNDSDGYMDHVHELRDLYAADLVHIVVDRGDACGRAFLNLGESSAEDEAYGFGFTVDLCGGLTFAHELGHNMGLAHDRYEVGVPAEGSHYGYVNQRMFEAGAPESARWHTIMAYPSQCDEAGDFYCEQIGYFSNPELTYIGDPMGVPADHPSTGVDGPADAVRTLNERREITANFRRSSASPTPRVHLTLSPYWLSEDGGVSTVTVTLHRPSGADTVVTVTASPSDAVSLSEDRTLTIPAGQTVSAGAVTITGVDNGNQTGDVSVEVSATATNPSSLGVIDPEPVALAIIDDETTPVVTLSLSPVEIVEGGEWTYVTATLDNRSVADTTVAVSATPAEVVYEIHENTLTIPAGQTASVGWGARIEAVDDAELTIAKKSVTVSGTAMNPHGVTGPESVTLTIIDDEAPFFADESNSYTFTEGIAASRFLPEAAYGNGTLTYSLSPAPSNGVTFTPGPPARIATSTTSVARGEASYTLTATDADGDTDTMTISIVVRKGVCPNSAAVSGYAGPGIVGDCEALLASRDALGGDKSLNWSEDLSIGEWEGISISKGRVARLHLVDQGLTGTVPSELGSLTNLQSLSLDLNHLTGEIPAELGNLSNLQQLSLWENQLTGGIPTELGSLANLQRLYLYNNQLTGEIPTELGSLANLQRLVLNNNQLTGEIPTELGSLANLQRLSLSGNQLTGGIPTELGSLAYLKVLSLARNQLTGAIPPELGGLANLFELYLADNQLMTGCVPDGLRDVPNNDIERLGLPFCSEHPCVTGGAVEDATNGGLVSDCATLLAARDVLSGTAALNWSADTPIADWSGVVLGGSSGRVTELHLSGLGLTGQVPFELGSLSNLQELYLGGNRLTGCVPDGLRDVPNNDLARLGLPFCSEHPCVAGGAVVDATNFGLMSDCDSLLAARDTLAGTASLNWVADTPITQWDGVIVGGTPKRVRGLSLEDGRLTGEIPTELGSLANLQGLYLYNNQLTGEIPTELGSLANLQELYLSENQLTGEIPKELGSLANLQGLYLYNNQLTGEIPTELGSLANLKNLDLGGNQLTGEIPTELGSLANLRWLYLYNNQLAGEIPTELGNLANLQQLSLWGNQLTGGIPTELGNLANLQGLYLYNNQLTGEIPTELGSLANLQGLVLYNNQLTGGIPTELGSLANLQGLSLSRNQLTGEIPAELGNLANLQQLSLWGNQLTGGIPTELGNLDLQGLYLRNNQLTGGIPKELGSLANLLGLDLSGNQLTGEIPKDLGSLANLQQLSLWGNQLTGEIPKELGNLANLERLYLSKNQLTGCIPYGLRHVVDNDFDELGLPFCADDDAVSCAAGGAVPDAAKNPELEADCDTLLTARDTLAGTASLNWAADTPITQWDGVTVGGTPKRVRVLSLEDGGLTGEIPTELGSLANLERLVLYNNQLTGEIPKELGNLANLQQLSLWGNQLTGEIPKELGNFANLLGLDLGGNQLTGGIPTELGSLANLQELYLYNNQLTGEIPTELGNLANLQQLSLWGNQLTGEIPAELGNFANLQGLSLSRNQLTGEIPAELGNLANLEWLVLYNNQLTGGIPKELGNFANLLGLDLGGNQLTGGIPTELGSLANLQELYLYNNQLTGEIPTELGSLANLQGLYLYNNQLTGEILAELGNLANLQQLSLWGNQLTGEIPKELGNLANLRRLYLPNNQLTGEIPKELGNLANLERLELGGNQLTGGIPTELGSLANLELLVLYNNQLTGGIPTELGSLANLLVLDLDGNQLTGEIPTELGSLANLQGLSLRENQLTGGIPTELGSLANLERLYLSENQLTGCIPYGLRHVVDNDFDELGLPFCADDDAVSCAAGGAVPDAAKNPELEADCDTLLTARDTLAGTASLNWAADTPITQWDGVTVGGTPKRVRGLSLEDGGLTGEIPAELGNLANLRWLVLFNNQLTGAIPVELGDLSNLQGLTLNQNQLTGEIPAELGNLANLQHLDLGGNQLTGEIPKELGSLANLLGLSLYNNQLAGEIPKELGNLANLLRLSLWGNQLTGGIPKELGSLANLQGLYLFNNQLTGEIPKELGNLANLLGLFLSENQLTGCTPGGLRDVADNDLDELGLPFCDVLLSGLTVSPGSLVPQFDPYRTDYSASVGLSPVTVTVAATNDHNATFLFLDDNDLVLVDADRTLEGFQVEFGAGVPAINIRVVSQDNQATHTYTITDLGNRYDVNDDRAIQRDEVITAIKDYFNDVITREEAIEVIKLYFSS